MTIKDFHLLHPPEAQPICRNCKRALGQKWDTWSIRYYGIQWSNDGSKPVVVDGRLVLKQRRLQSNRGEMVKTWHGEWGFDGKGRFCTQRCAADYAHWICDQLDKPDGLVRMTRIWMTRI